MWDGFPLLAHFRNGAMSDLSPECASKRMSPHRYMGLPFKRTAQRRPGELHISPGFVLV
jgi:hypothetical protein